MWTLVGLLLGAVHIAFAGAYFYLTWHHKYWQKRGVVTAEPLTILGTYPGILADKSRSLILDVQEVYNKYKTQHRAVGTFLTRQPQLLVLDPALAHEVLVDKFSNFRDTITSSYVGHNPDDKFVHISPFFSAGDDWKRRRTENGGGLTPSKLKMAFTIWEQSGKKLLEYMERARHEQGDIIETRDLAYRFMANTMADFIWGIDAGSLTSAVGEISPFQKTSTAFTITAFQSIIRFNKSLVAPFLRKLLQMRFFTKDSDEFYLQLTRDAIKLRQSGSGSDRTDYLSHLMQLQQRGNCIADSVGYALSVLLDGYETSAAVLYHLLYTLSENHEEQEKLRTELTEALHAEEHISYEKLNALPYLDQCLNESLRLTSPIGFFMRICTKATQLDLGNGKVADLEPGTSVMIPAYQFHHDDGFYTEASRFQPERFDNGAATVLTKRGCFLPFGDGPRVCLGMRVGQLSVKTAILHILTQYQVEQTEKVPMDADSGLGIFLNGDVRLKYTKCL
ncbi:probable cytochrome P450 309a1 [Drosophila guanche]|uniref:Blast:Probable cytochrome P450 309a1 n=1 Tax=Drosophila guanche TaxID=7266 RepID=A0A3B0JM07_DROGU|nr:probable cytochrome P450 309a1 [Drosophila guanche]SPP81883.1 blast:Probable cytochrome P450 309a1 [Drosophila guanche]